MNVIIKNQELLASQLHTDIVIASKDADGPVLII